MYVMDINEIVMETKIYVDGETVNLEFFLGGDYKLILLMLGLSGATSNYACAWCKIHKAEVEHDLRFESLQLTRSPANFEGNE